MNLIECTEFLSMLFLSNPTLWAVQKDENLENEEALKVIEFCDGYQAMNEVDPKTQETALYVAVEAQNQDLIKALAERGAETTEADWQKFGEIVCDIMKEVNEEKAKEDNADAVLEAQKKLENFFNLQNTYDCIDWDASTWQDDKGNTLMHYCAMQGTKQTAQILLEQARIASILSNPNDDHKTPIECCNDEEIVRVFQEYLNEYEVVNPMANQQVGLQQYVPEPQPQIFYQAAPSIHGQFVQDPNQFVQQGNFIPNY